MAKTSQALREGLPKIRQQMETTATTKKKIVPTDADYLCGRPSKCLNNPGTLFVKQRCTSLLQEYVAAEKDKVMRINKGIVEEVFARGGRFLTERDGEWTVLSVPKSREKVAVMFHNLKFRRPSQVVPVQARLTQTSTANLNSPDVCSDGKAHDESLKFTKIFEVLSIDPNEPGPKKIVSKFKDTLVGVRLLMTKKEDTFTKILTSCKVDEVDIIQLQEFRVWFRTQYMKASAGLKPVFSVHLWLAYQEAEAASYGPDVTNHPSQTREASLPAAPLAAIENGATRVVVGQQTPGTVTEEKTAGEVFAMPPGRVAASFPPPHNHATTALPVGDIHGPIRTELPSPNAALPPPPHLWVQSPAPSADNEESLYVRHGSIVPQPPRHRWTNRHASLFVPYHTALEEEHESDVEVQSDGSFAFKDLADVSNEEFLSSYP